MTRSTPHSFNCSACSGVNRPKQAQIFRLYCRLISRNDRGDGPHFTFVRPAGRNHDAIRAGIALGREAGAIEQFLAAQQVVPRNLGLRDLRLRTVGAIFRTQPTLGIHQEIKLNVVAEPPPPHAIRGRHQVEQFFVWALQYAERLLAWKASRRRARRRQVAASSSASKLLRHFGKVMEFVMQARWDENLLIGR